MNLFGVPAWLFLVVAIASLFIGVALRHYLDARKARAEQAHREEVKELKKRLKRDKKKAKQQKRQK